MGSRLIPNLFAASLLSLLVYSEDSSLQAQEIRDTSGAKVLKYEIVGELREQTREALARLIEHPTLEKILVQGSNSVETVDHLCANEKCLLATENDLKSASSRAKRAYDKFAGHLGSKTLPQITVDNEAGISPGIDGNGRIKDFLILNSNDPIVESTKLRSVINRIVNGTLAIQLNAKQIKEAVSTGDITVGKLASGPGIHFNEETKLGTIDQDLRLTGTSSRQVRFNHLIDAQERAELMDRVSADPAIADLQTQEDFVEEVTLIVPEESDLTEFELSGSSCKAADTNWPFNATDLANLITFNSQVLKESGLWPVERTKILVVDTGINHDFITNQKFRDLVYVNQAEVLSANTGFLRDSNVGPLHRRKRCIDFDDNGHFADYFGASPSAENHCYKADFAESRLNPITKRPGSTQSYFPDHGAIVATIAAGGPSLLTNSPELPELIGLVFYRISDSAGSDPKRSVDVDAQDIINALDYARDINAHVVNLSFKTAQQQVFKQRNLEGHPSLFVTSAGNFPINLASAAQDNRPASLPPNHFMRRQMLVVGALKNDPESPLWDKSAYSGTRVDIAAPGVGIPSFDNQTKGICGAGTSAAAPLVTFTTALLNSFGIKLIPAQIERIKLTAEFDPLLTKQENGALVDAVNGKLKLDMQSAIDVFVDQVKLVGAEDYQRVWIEGDPSANDMLQVCGTGNNLPQTGHLSASKGLIDIAYLASWQRTQDGKSHISHWLDDFESPKAIATQVCNMPDPDSSLKVRNLTDQSQREIAWRDIEKIVTTPFRNAKDAVFRASQ